MSTRSTIYYHEADEETPHIHIFSEWTFEDGPDTIFMEVKTLLSGQRILLHNATSAVIIFPLPADLVKRFGL